RAGRFTHLAALVEQILQDLVGLELERVRLVHLPPELLVALEAGGETGLGEAGSLRSHGAKGSAGVGQEARGILGSGLALDSTRVLLHRNSRREVDCEPPGDAQAA